jgi:hypothetical protein
MTGRLYHIRAGCNLHDRFDAETARRVAGPDAHASLRDYGGNLVHGIEQTEYRARAAIEFDAR